MSLKFSDRQIWSNIVSPNQTAPDQGLQCLSFRVHLSSALVFSQIKLFKVQDITSMCVSCFRLNHGRPNIQYDTLIILRATLIILRAT